MFSKAVLLDALTYDPENGLFWHRKSGKPALVTVHRPHGYLTGNVMGKRLLAHRVAWAITYDEWPDQIDHRNRVKSDNRISNLRNVSAALNSLNREMPPGKFRGVTKAHNRNVWMARISDTYLGCFPTAEAAASAYDSAAILAGLPAELLNHAEQIEHVDVNGTCKRPCDQ